jgi:hypothetical protein
VRCSRVLARRSHLAVRRYSWVSGWYADEKRQRRKCSHSVTVLCCSFPFTLGMAGKFSDWDSEFPHLNVTAMGWAYRATHEPWPVAIYCASPSDFKSFLVCPPEISRKYQQRRLVAKQATSSTLDTWEWPGNSTKVVCEHKETHVVPDCVNNLPLREVPSSADIQHECEEGGWGDYFQLHIQEEWSVPTDHVSLLLLPPRYFKLVRILSAFIVNVAGQ